MPLSSSFRHWRHTHYFILCHALWLSMLIRRFAVVYFYLIRWDFISFPLRVFRQFIYIICLFLLLMMLYLFSRCFIHFLPAHLNTSVISLNNIVFIVSSFTFMLCHFFISLYLATLIRLVLPFIDIILLSLITLLIYFIDISLSSLRFLILVISRVMACQIMHYWLFIFRSLIIWYYFLMNSSFHQEWVSAEFRHCRYFLYMRRHAFIVCMIFRF